jgi:hypothetical protein
MTRKARAIAKTHDEIFASMAEGLDHAISIARGEADLASYRSHVPVDVDVKAVRKKNSARLGAAPPDARPSRADVPVGHPSASGRTRCGKSSIRLREGQRLWSVQAGPQLTSAPLGGECVSPHPINLRLSISIHGNKPLKPGLLRHLAKLPGIPESELH